LRNYHKTDKYIKEYKGSEKLTHNKFSDFSWEERKKLNGVINETEMKPSKERRVL